MEKTLTCHHCNQTFNVTNERWKSARSKNKIYGTPYFCNKKCRLSFHGKHSNPLITVNCKNCDVTFKKASIQIRIRPDSNHFCTNSCASSFNNKNKKWGTRISKLEKWIQNQLIQRYPNLEIIFNNKEVIGSELDVYFPALKLAIEINGIHHYRPIYGDYQFNRITVNDRLKKEKCLENNIELLVIDTRSQKQFSPESSKDFLERITERINIFPKGHVILKLESRVRIALTYVGLQATA